MADGPERGSRRIRGVIGRLRQPSDECRRELANLRAAVAVLEEEVQENRRLNRRLAEITDIVQELLLPAAQRDDDRLRERLDSYTSSL